MASEKKSWLELQHPKYQASIAKWRYARHVYEATLLDRTVITEFLRQKAQGESDEAYEERRELADFTNYFAKVLDSFVGMLANVESDANRIFRQKDTTFGLGDPADSTTPIGRLWQQASPDGRGYLSVWDLLATELGITHLAWILTSSVGDARDARISVLQAERVPNWRWGTSGILEEVLVEELVDGRGSLQEEPAELRQFMYYRLGGSVRNQPVREGQGIWQRWELDTKTKVERLIDQGAYRLASPDGSPALPIFPSELTLKRMVGYLMARKNVALFNKESELDALLRACGFPKLIYAGEPTAFNEFKKDHRKGINLMQLSSDAKHSHGYIAPPSDPATVMKDVLEMKTRAFYEVASAEYSDSVPRQKTATQTRQETGTGPGAYLHHKKVTLDSSENGALWRVAQILYPNERRHWYVNRVERSDDFMPIDRSAVAETLQKRAFGETPAPVGLTGLVNAATEIAKLQGQEVDVAQLTAHVQATMLLDAFATLPGLPAPAAVRAELLMFVLTAAGVNVANAKAAIQAFAEKEDLQKERESQTFDDKGDDVDDDDDVDDPAEDAA